MANLSLTLALERRDRSLPLLDGAASIDGVDLTVLDIESNDRHHRMLQEGEFDVAEVSLSSYLIACDQGLPFTAIPSFPHRYFSQSQMFRNLAAGVVSPRDLVGRRVGLNSYQTSLSVLAKGDLHREYGVPWKEIRWVTGRPETIPVGLPSDVVVEESDAPRDVSAMLVSGEIAALMTPGTPRCIAEGDPRVGSLFPDVEAEQRAHFRRNGYFPIMHLFAFRNEVLEQHEWLARAAMDVFDRANQEAFKRHGPPKEEKLLGKNPWVNGFAANRRDLERFISYSHEQGLIRKPIAVEELFDESTLDT